MKRAILLAGLALAGCGGGSEHRVRVFAAASLTHVLPLIDHGVQYTFGGSDMLAAQIGQGAPADVFAAASPKGPQALASRGLLERPTAFASNRLVLVAAPASHLRTVADIARPGVKLVIGGAGVPVGAYTRQVLSRLALSGALRNVRSQATDVQQVLAQVTLGQADAGFVYVTDARTARTRVRVIGLPASAQPVVRYEVALRRGDSAGRSWLAKLLSPRGQSKLRAAGFGAP